MKEKIPLSDWLIIAAFLTWLTALVFCIATDHGRTAAWFREPIRLNIKLRD